MDGSVREIGTCHPEPEREESKRLRADADRSIVHRTRARPPMFADERRQPPQATLASQFSKMRWYSGANSS